MELKNVELGTNIKFTDETGTHYFAEGDNVICIVGDKRYTGTITCVGTYKDDEQEFLAFSLNTSDKNRPFSYSSEIIKVDDITYICKNPLADDIPEMTDEERDKKTFCTVLKNVTGGNDKAVENVYDKMKNVMELFDIPLDKAIACSIYSFENRCSIYEPLNDICGIDMKALEDTLPALEKARDFSALMALHYFGDVIKTFCDWLKTDEK